MVFLTQLLRISGKMAKKIEKSGMLDTLKLYVRAGIGGAGLPQYGGKGGRGGHVYVVSKSGVTLKQLKSKLAERKLRAEPGWPSRKKGIIGLPGRDLVIKVPVGVSVCTDSGIKLGEVNEEGEKLLVAKGGLGGCQETGYCGMKGEARSIRLDLRLIADVGLVGFPNAGKSTLLNVISKAKPKIANYPFTTLAPHLGMLRYEDGREISVADLPGLVEGAHMNQGLGLRFLKHVERTKVLLFVSDIQGFRMSVKYHRRSCLETLLLLNKEIEMYKPDLLDMPAMLLINKMDTKGAEETYKELRPKLDDLSEHVTEIDEESRPKKILKFANIMTASLAQRKPDEIVEIKKQIRETIDRYAVAPDELAIVKAAEKRLWEKLERPKEDCQTPTLI